MACLADALAILLVGLECRVNPMCCACPCPPAGCLNTILLYQSVSTARARRAAAAGTPAAAASPGSSSSSMQQSKQQPQQQRQAPPEVPRSGPEGPPGGFPALQPAT